MAWAPFLYKWDFGMIRFFFLFATAFLPVLAFAQANDLQLKVERLERDLNMLQAEYYRTSKGMINIDNISDEDAKALARQQQQMHAGLELKLNEIQESIRQLVGKQEEQEFANRKNAEELRKLKEDIEFRLNALEGKNTAATSPIPSTPSTSSDGTKLLGTMVVDPAKQELATTGKKPKEKDDPKERYDAAFELLRQSKYDEARNGFEGFLVDFPDHTLASSAYFWLGETYFIRKEYEPAAVEYLKGYRKDQKGPKAPDNLLKLAMSLGSAKKQNEACTVFDKLGREFPNASAPIKRKAELERTKYKCGTR